MARESEEHAATRRARVKLAIILLLCLMLLAVFAVFLSSGILDRVLSRPSETETFSGAGPSRLVFVYPKDTPSDRILLTTGVSIALSHIDKAPDQITLGTPPGDLTGSFTWTIIPHQGSHVVRRLIGEAEWQGRVYKLCEAIDDTESPTPQFAEHYFPINDAGVHYRIPQTLDHVPFVTFLNAVIAQIPIGQRPIGQAAPQAIRVMAERLIPLCTGQAQ